MHSQYTPLSDLGPAAIVHQSDVRRVARQLGIEHNYFDCWLFGFLENKNFNIEETVAKLHRREEFEKNELATYEFTDWMRTSLRSGIVQDLGYDKLGRTVLYVCTARDKPESKHRAESRRTFDMFVSYGTRLRPESKRCQMTLLVNQSKASMRSNTDMTLQAEIALRIAKYYPGMVDKVYVCNMGRIFSAMFTPVYYSLPSIVSDRIQIVTESEVKHGKLLEYFDAEVLPVDLGGRNTCDHATHWNGFATRVEEYYGGLKHAVVKRGLSVKEWELECLGEDANLDSVSTAALSQSLRMFSASYALSPQACSPVHLSTYVRSGNGRCAASSDMRGRRRQESALSTPPNDMDCASSIHTCISEADLFQHHSATPNYSSNAVDHDRNDDHGYNGADAPPAMTSHNDDNRSGGNYYNASDDRASAQMGYMKHSKTSSGIPIDRFDRQAEQPCDNSWAAVMSVLPRGLALFFMEELLDWRAEIEQREMAERLQLIDLRAVAWTRRQRNKRKGLSVRDGRWYTMVPHPLRQLYRIVLLGVTFANLIYFAVAFVFASVLTASLVVTVFFGFQLSPLYFFPLNCVLANLIIQGPSLCTRVSEVIWAVCKSTIIPPFERFGSYWGSMLEVILFFSVVCVQIIVFAVFTARRTPLYALQMSFASGLLCAFGIALILHALFFTSILLSSSSSRGTRSRTNPWSKLPFLLSLRPTTTSSAIHHLYHHHHHSQQSMVRLSSILICGVPLSLSMLLGIGFMISHEVTLFVSTAVSSILAAICVTYYSDVVSFSLDGSLVRLTLWMMVVVWLYAIFAVGFQFQFHAWAVTVCVGCGIHSLFVLVAVLSLVYPNVPSLWRVTFIILLLYLLASWVMLFPARGYALGLTCLVFMVHNVLCVVLAHRTPMNLVAVLSTSMAVLLLIVAVVLLGWSGTTLQYTVPQSMPSAQAANAAAASAATGKHARVDESKPGRTLAGQNHDAVFGRSASSAWDTTSATGEAISTNALTRAQSSACYSSSSTASASYRKNSSHRIGNDGHNSRNDSVAAAALSVTTASSSSMTFDSAVDIQTRATAQSASRLDPSSYTYLACALRFGQDASYTITDVSLMTELTMARTESLLRDDFANWFGKDNRGLVYDGVVERFRYYGATWEMHRFRTTATTSSNATSADGGGGGGANATFLVLNNRYTVTSILTLVSWVNCIALFPFTSILPWSWSMYFVYATSFMHDLVGFSWNALYSDVAEYLVQARAELQTHVIVSGYGVMGGVVSVAAARSQTQAVVFSAPSILHLLRSVGLDLDTYRQYVLSIAAHASVLASIGGDARIESQGLTCEGSALHCQSQQFVSKELLTACGDVYHRRHV